MPVVRHHVHQFVDLGRRQLHLLPDLLQGGLEHRRLDDAVLGLAAGGDTGLRDGSVCVCVQWAREAVR